MILFENEFCKIEKRDDSVVRVDKILQSEMEVNSYFNESGNLVRL